MLHYHFPKLNAHDHWLPKNTDLPSFAAANCSTDLSSLVRVTIMLSLLERGEKGWIKNQLPPIYTGRPFRFITYGLSELKTFTPWNPSEAT